MATSRRNFLKTSIIAGASASIPALPALSSAQTIKATQHHAPAPARDAAFTRGIGVYPGAPGESFCPTFEIDTAHYRNLALLRPATHSSAYDYNLTAQLVTDGIKDVKLPRWISASSNTHGILPKELRETLLDHWEANTLNLTGSPATTDLHFGGGDAVPEIDQVRVFVAVPAHFAPAGITFTIATSVDGATWTPAGSVIGPAPLAADLSKVTYPPDLVRGNNLFFPTIVLSKPQRSRFYQLQLTLADAPENDVTTPWRVGQIEFYHAGKRVEFGGPYDFTSAWMSAGLDEEWVAVDLGAPCTFDRVTLHWIARAAEGSVQASSDGVAWHTLRTLPASTDAVDDLPIKPAAHARYVRVLMTRPGSPDGYILSEFEVYGRGGPVPKPVAAKLPTPEGRLELAGGAWRLQRDSLVEAPGVAISKANFSDADWLPATVPGTILASYQNAGAIPDPNYGSNQLYISDSFFYADFWFRNVFTPPAAQSGQMQWLCFDGIDWKAEVFLNGESLGHINGAFMRGRFDVTSKLVEAQPNILAVRVLKNDTPGSCKQKTYASPGPNGGAPGADNPTFHASIGWDWIPTIRGRNTGIWGNVFVETTGSVTLENPSVISTVPDTATAHVTIGVELVNHLAQPISGTLRGRFGDTPVEQKVTLASASRQHVTFAPLTIKDPQLWWPVGYGDAHLYDVELTFEANGAPTDRKLFKAGVRQMTANEDGGKLRLFINGRRFIPRGGNWGFAESMLRYRAREYDAAVRYHREMNFTMIRNWVGQVPDNAFYEACDRHGVVVWQDFWLANPWDGPIPNDNALFLANARDTILRIRHHGCIGLYCGRNEGYPPPALEAGLRKLLAELHPDIHYIGSSADDVVSGHGPYRALPPTTYFRHADAKFHSEIGMPNIPSIESVQAMMPASSVWPQALDWGIHDFSQSGAQGAATFNSIIEENYGGAQTAEEWVTLAQFLNYDGYRAMFEAQSRDRMGVLLWMSHPCWPSFVWQTYDYYLEPTAAYFGCKKASEPIHIQWNRLTNNVEVVNLSGGNLTGLAARMEMLNLDGQLASSQSANFDSREDSVNPVMAIHFTPTLTPVHFMRLTLTHNSDILSVNFYMRGVVEDDYRAIRALPKAKIEATRTVTRNGDTWLLTTELHNNSEAPALMVRLKAVRETAGDRILPVLYDDNYVTLMPDERRTFTTEVNHTDTRGQRPHIVISGFNVTSS